MTTDTITTLHQPEIQEMITSWIANRFENYVNRMPSGAFLNNHNAKFENADGIVMLVSGEVCPVFKNTLCSLNPLIINDDHVSLSTSAVAGTVIGLNKSLTETVDNYNKGQLEFIKRTELKSFGRYAIIAYRSFHEDW